MKKPSGKPDSRSHAASVKVKFGSFFNVLASVCERDTRVDSLLVFAGSCLAGMMSFVPCVRPCHGQQVNVHIPYRARTIHCTTRTAQGSGNMKTAGQGNDAYRVVVTHRHSHSFYLL
jgi:hypothetical protein